MSQRSVLVVGATGRQGGTVVDHLLSGEHGSFDVHALTRSPESAEAKALADRGAMVVKGNLLDKGRLVPAIEAVDAIYCVTTFGQGDFDAEIEQGTNMAEVAADIGIEHFVFSSVAGADRNTGLRHVESKLQIEERIRDLDLQATILRLRFFMQNLESQREAVSNGTLAFPIEENASRQMLDIDDLGMFAATVLAAPEEYIGETIGLAGDEHTLESAAEVFSTVTGTTVEPKHVPVEVARERLIEANGEALGNDLANMFEWHNNHDLNDVVSSFERDHGVALSGLEAYLRKNGWEQ